MDPAGFEPIRCGIHRDTSRGSDMSLRWRQVDIEQTQIEHVLFDDTRSPDDCSRRIRRIVRDDHHFERMALLNNILSGEGANERRNAFRFVARRDADHASPCARIRWHWRRPNRPREGATKTMRLDTPLRTDPP